MDWKNKAKQAKKQVEQAKNQLEDTTKSVERMLSGPPPAPNPNPVAPPPPLYFIGRKPGGAAMQEIYANCREGERPEFIVGAGAGGVLAAFKDRCIIVKKGALTGWMSGATGGGRTAVFNYANLTAIEVNTGWTSATVEILTESHDAGRAKDYWHIGGRGGGNQDAWKMPNVLAMGKKEYEQARKQFDWIRDKAAEARRTVVVANPVQPQADMADQIRKLVELRDSGALTEAEFAAAKTGTVWGEYYSGEAE